MKAIEDLLKVAKAIVEGEKVKVVIKARFQSIKEYKILVDFKNKVAEASSVAYIYGFRDYKASLQWMVPKLDLRHFCPANSC